MAHELFGQSLRGNGGEEASVDVGEVCGLALDRFDHAGVAMAKAADGRTPRAVKNATALGIDDPYALSSHGDRRWRAPQRAMQQMAAARGIGGAGR